MDLYHHFTVSLHEQRLLSFNEATPSQDAGAEAVKGLPELSSDVKMAMHLLHKDKAWTPDDKFVQEQSHIAGIEEAAKIRDLSPAQRTQLVQSMNAWASGMEVSDQSGRTTHLTFAYHDGKLQVSIERTFTYLPSGVDEKVYGMMKAMSLVQQGNAFYGEQGFISDIQHLTQIDKLPQDQQRQIVALLNAQAKKIRDTEPWRPRGVTFAFDPQVGKIEVRWSEGKKAPMMGKVYREPEVKKPRASTDSYRNRMVPSYNAALREANAVFTQYDRNSSSEVQRKLDQYKALVTQQQAKFDSDESGSKERNDVVVELGKLHEEITDALTLDPGARRLDRPNRFDPPAVQKQVLESVSKKREALRKDGGHKEIVYRLLMAKDASDFTIQQQMGYVMSKEDPSYSAYLRGKAFTQQEKAELRETLDWHLQNRPGLSDETKTALRNLAGTL